MTLECTLVNVTDGSKFLGKIVNVSIDEKVGNAFKDGAALK
ncbi:hypothetical protein [Claveliimonas monacensis]|nr:hypothetical protein [Claveliimonas monacensis]